MKKLILSGLLMAFGFLANAQNTQDTISTKNSGISGNNEIKLNLIYTIAGFPEITYERILKDDMSIGVSLLVGIEEEAEYSFGFIPHYRIYFGKKKANGFFIEGNAAVISTKDDYYEYIPSSSSYYPPDGYGSYNYTISKTYTNFGLGAAAGAKFLTKNGFVGEIYLGVGRLFGSNSIDAYARGGITIGKRF